MFEELYRENVIPRNYAAVICAMRPLARRFIETAARFGAIKLFVANLHSRARVTTHFPSFILLNLTMNKGLSSEKKNYSCDECQLYTEIGKKAWLFAKLQPGGARKRINAN